MPPADRKGDPIAHFPRGWKQGLRVPILITEFQYRGCSWRRRRTRARRKTGSRRRPRRARLRPPPLRPSPRLPRPRAGWCRRTSGAPRWCRVPLRPRGLPPRRPRGRPAAPPPAPPPAAVPPPAALPPASSAASGTESPPAPRVELPPGDRPLLEPHLDRIDPPARDEGSRGTEGIEPQLGPVAVPPDPPKPKRWSKLPPPLMARTTDRLIDEGEKPRRYGAWIVLGVVILLGAGGFWLWREGRLDADSDPGP